MRKIKPSFSKRTALNLHSAWVKTQIKLHDLTYLFWECTLRCNMQCLHCGSDCRVDSTMEDMPADDFLKVTESIKTKFSPEKVMIVLTGGEPLMRKDLEYVGSELQKQGYAWGMVSNGYALTESKLNSLRAAGLKSVSLSLDGMQESHEWLRGAKNGWNKAVNALEHIVKAPDMVYDIVTCVNQRNINELEGIKDFLISKGAKRWRLFSIDPIGRAAELPELNLNNKELRQLMDFLEETRKEGKIKASYGCEGFLGSYEGKVRDGFFFCRAGVNIGSVLADGGISACPNNSRNMIQGNIYKDDFLEVWNNRYEAYRDRKRYKTGVCSDCDMWKYCLGNGMHLRNHETGEVMRCHYGMLGNSES